MTLTVNLLGCSQDTWIPIPAEKEFTYENPDFRGGIVFYSDSQWDHFVHYRVLTNILAFEPVTVFHSGDLVQNGGDPVLWSVFDLLTVNLMTGAEFFPVQGNHDEPAGSGWLDRWTLPGNELYYTVLREGILFVLLDSNLSLEAGSDQRIWLENELAANQSGPGYPVILIFHKPVKTTGHHHDDDYPARDDLLAITGNADNGIIATVSGHDHNYERLEDSSGVVYLVIGGSGGVLRPQEVFDNPESLIFVSQHHHVVMVRDGQTLRFLVFSMDREILDSFTIDI